MVKRKQSFSLAGSQAWSMVFSAPIQPKPGSASKQSLRPAVDAAAVQQQWLSTFAQIDDPRGRQGIEHAFLSIVMIAVFATLGGATGWDEIETLCREP